MATNCLIDKGVAFNCAAPVIGGVEQRVIIGNFDDWKNSTVTIDTGVSEEITGITLAAGGVQFYEFETPKSGVNIIPNTPLRVVDGGDGFDHTVDLKVRTLGELDRLNIAKIRYNKVVCIVPLLGGGALLYGGFVNATPEPGGVGLRLSDYQEIPSDASLGGMIQFILKTPDDDPPEQSPAQKIAASFDLETLLTPTA